MREQITYGKSLDNLLKIKSDFFLQNNSLLRKKHMQAAILNDQPLRKHCKLCNASLPMEHPVMESQHIRYFSCKECGHINSEHEDTDNFAHQVYIKDNYNQSYSEENKAAYINRMQTIYMPKAEYMLNSLEADGLSKEKIHLLDIGAGAGYFVKALHLLKISSIGIEISKSQVDFSNAMADDIVMHHVAPTEVGHFIKTEDCNVLSAIGVFEHITNLQAVLNIIKQNKHIQYIFLSVPMFSFSCIFEASHQTCFNRHTGGTHTHLFTQESLHYMAKALDFEVAYQWEFGTDMMDLFRFICVCLEQNNNHILKEHFVQRFLPLLNDMQLLVDKSGFSSETHMILRRK